MWQVIIWTNADFIHWHIYAALGGDELKRLILLYGYDYRWNIFTYIIQLLLFVMHTESNSGACCCGEMTAMCFYCLPYPIYRSRLNDQMASSRAWSRGWSWSLLEICKQPKRAPSTIPADQLRYQHQRSLDECSECTQSPHCGPLWHAVEGGSRWWRHQMETFSA